MAAVYPAGPEPRIRTLACLGGFTNQPPAVCSTPAIIGTRNGRAGQRAPSACMAKCTPAARRENPGRAPAQARLKYTRSALRNGAAGAKISHSERSQRNKRRPDEGTAMLGPGPTGRR
ncbi:Uncharacterised protein [Bordetella pertussis]|nr:Uncharacterised protein [Bordetella pertussis]